MEEAEDENTPQPHISVMSKIAGAKWKAQPLEVKKVIIITIYNFPNFLDLFGY